MPSASELINPKRGAPECREQGKALPQALKERKKGRKKPTHTHTHRDRERDRHAHTRNAQPRQKIYVFDNQFFHNVSAQELAPIPETFLQFLCSSVGGFQRGYYKGY